MKPNKPALTGWRKACLYWHKLAENRAQENTRLRARVKALKRHLKELE